MKLASTVNKENTIIKIADKDDICYISTILESIEKTNKIESIGIMKCSLEYLEMKIYEEKAIIALVDSTFAGFCHIESWDNNQYVTPLRLTVDNRFQGFDLERKIREKAFRLSREKFPEAKLFSLATTAAAVKINTEIGFVPVTYSEGISDEFFWRGCQGCKNYDILTRSEQRYCTCTAMLYDPNSEIDDFEKQLVSKGYTVVSVHNKNMFGEILRSFEDYAKLKGYNIIFSIEYSIQNKIAFKFHGMDSINIDEQKIRKDILEYVENIKKGTDFIDDLPIMISEEEHLLIANLLKNKVNSLTLNYKLAMKKQSIINIQIGNNQSFKITNDSENISQGDNNSVKKDTDNSAHSIITVTNSFNEKIEQIEKIDKIIQLLGEEKELEAEIKQTLISNFDKIRKEFIEKEQPNKRKIFEYLINIKKGMEIVTLTHWTAEAIESFINMIHA